jgi:RNA polymerase sigma-70 factor (ECF subfamily)
LLTETELLRVYEEQTRTLYAYVSRRVGGDRALAEDIVQETWFRAVAGWRRRGLPERPGAWLVHVARNLLASHFRRKRPEPVAPAELDLRAGGAWPETESAAALLSWGLARVRRQHADVLEAFYLEGRSTREIAESRGLSERSVEGRLRRARQSLARRLRPFIEPDGSRPDVDVGPGARAGSARVLEEG